MEQYIENGDIEKVKKCVYNGTFEQNKGEDGIDYIAIALENNEFEIADFLFQHEFEIENANDDGVTDLHYLVKSATIQAIEKMVSYGADIHRVDNDNENVIHHACLGRNEENAIYLINLGVDVNAKSKRGELPIDYVFSYQLLDVLKYLENNLHLLNDDSLSVWKKKRLELIF